MNNDKISSSIIFVRLIVGAVFLSEGIQKFIFPALLGTGRFIKIGLPAPEFLAYFVGSFEAICGLFILVGLFTRYAAIPLIIIMLVAIASTKIPIIINEGFWAMAHAARVDWSMLLGSIFLLITGPGKFSLNKYFLNKKETDV